MAGNWAVQQNRFGFEPKITTFNFKPISHSRAESIDHGINIASSELVSEQLLKPAEAAVEQPLTQQTP